MGAALCCIKLLALTLLVAWVVADDHYATVAANYLALVANLLNAWVNLHHKLLFYKSLFVAVNDAPTS